MPWLFPTIAFGAGVFFTLLGVSIFTSFDVEERDKQFWGIAALLGIGDSLLILSGLITHGVI